jgi:hypothetical protein
MRAEVARLSPGDLKGYDKFLKDSEARYWFGFEDLGRRPMHKLLDLIKVLPTFAMMRADRSVYAHAARGCATRACAWRCRSTRCSSAAIRSTSPRCISWSAIWRRPSASITPWAACRRSPRPWRGGRGAGRRLVMLGAEVDEILVKAAARAGVRWPTAT